MKPDPRSTSEKASSKASAADVTEQVAADKWNEEPKAIRRTFPGPRDTGVPLRVAMERKAFADVVSHAKESLDAEICGVLAGQICEDDEGLFVHVQAAVRGAAAREGNARVTFTQETWSTVHKTLERDYPKLRMVGWYHSHPGFGVEFSEMDVFIQKNFFPSPTQIALVTDPLGGETAICRNADQGVSYLNRFWVDGREHALRVPVSPPDKEPTQGSISQEREGQSFEARLGQLIQAVDEQRTLFHRFLITLLLMACLGIACGVGYVIYSSSSALREPPRLSGYVPVPVQVGDKTVLIGVGVVQWNVPPELNAVYLEMEKQKQAALEKQQQAAEKEASVKRVPTPGATAETGTQAAVPANNPPTPSPIAPKPTQPEAPKNP